MMKKSYDLLKDHPVNKKRIAEGKRPGNSIWLWGEGSKPALENFEEKFGMKGCIVSAVDLLKGIGIGAGMQVPEVEGATGYIDTNFVGKAECALRELKTHDFVYIHLEAPDECGHRNEPENKVRAIEIIDEKILGKLLPALEKYEDYTDYELFEEIGRKRGCIISGGEINTERCATMILDEFRGGKIGRITLEEP